MPIIKSAKKKVRQAKKHFARNQGMRTQLKTFMKKIVVLSKTDLEAASKMLPKAYSVIDTASKKHLIHPNNAARKKSLLAKYVAGKGGKAPIAKATKASKVKAAEGKVVEKTEKKTTKTTKAAK